MGTTSGTAKKGESTPSEGNRVSTRKSVSVTTDDKQVGVGGKKNCTTISTLTKRPAGELCNMAEEVSGRRGKPTTTILGTIINADNLMATMGNDILGTPANADNIMATTTDELCHGLFDDTSVNGGGQ